MQNFVDSSAFKPKRAGNQHKYLYEVWMTLKHSFQRSFMVFFKKREGYGTLFKAMPTSCARPTEKQIQGFSSELHLWKLPQAEIPTEHHSAPLVLK